MTHQFDYFVVLAAMRTGSNFLEANLNAFDGLACLGEAFNPHFIGYPNQTEILGVDSTMREADPTRLISAIKAEPEILNGFRYFHDHDPRVFDLIIDDPRCAKIILTRNPLDSYVSLKIARATGQWKLTNVKRRKEALALFDAEEFNTHVEAQQIFQLHVLNRLQSSAQTGFYLAYEDLQNLEVMNGLARWLGDVPALEALDDALKPQNPAPVLSKVANPAAMETALSGMDRFNLTRTPNFEPRRGPAVPTYVAAAKAPLLYMPVQGGPNETVLDWMAALDQVEVNQLPQGLKQKQLRQWMQDRPGFRSFTVLRHPLARVHSVFCRHLVQTGPGTWPKIRDLLQRQFKVPLPKGGPDQTYSAVDHRTAFEAFLDFLKLNLAGQTALRVEPSWATQSQVLSGFAEFATPDLVMRESDLADDLGFLARKCGYSSPQPPSTVPDMPFALTQIYDAKLERKARDLYRRDYLVFGFDDWNMTGQPI